MRTTTSTRAIAVLVLSNLLGGIGVASGVAVGGLLAEDLGGTAVAGLAQATSVLGAAIAAVPLASAARARGRRFSLAVGYVLATIGAAIIISAAVLRMMPLLLLGLALFGVSSATNLQSRYAAADHAPPATRARSMSVVIWATTVGAVAGPNLTASGDRLGMVIGLPHLAGPYLFSVVAFAAGAVVIALLLPSTPAVVSDDPGTASVGAWAALRWALGRAETRFAVVLIASAHAVMVMVMVMTPVHMQHNGMSLELVGVVISVHVLGMYALSPVFGALADRWGARTVAVLGMAILVLAATLGLLAAGDEHGSTLTAIALTFLGLGWSACVIASSATLTAVSAPEVRVPLQGVTDAGMNYAGAAAAALAGPILAFGGFTAVNLAALVLLVPAVVAAAATLRPRRPVADGATTTLAG